MRINNTNMPPMKFYYKYILLLCFVCIITNTYAQTPFEDFKKRAQNRYAEWKGKSNGGVISTSGDQARYSKKIEMGGQDITIWSLVIGVSSYSSMQSLKYADDDAYKIYSFLKSPEGGSVKEKNIQLLIDEDATKDKIFASLHNIVQKADSNDVIFFYFSGHGLEGAFLPFDYGQQSWQGKKLVKDTTKVISHELLADIFARSKAKHKLCFADACHSGSFSMAKGPSTPDNQYYKALESTKGGLALFTSSKTEEVSLEHQGVRQGVFSHYLIEGMYGLADQNQDYIVTIAELYDYVSQNVKSYTNYQQTPTISGAFDPLTPVSLIRK